MNISEKIRALRIEKGYTQKELGEIAGLATITIQQYEAGKYKPKIETVRRIASALSSSIFNLLDSDYSEFSPKDLEDSRAFATPYNEFAEINNRIALKKESDLLADYRLLNGDGQGEARKRVNELTQIKKYTEIEEPYDND